MTTTQTHDDEGAMRARLIELGRLIAGWQSERKLTFGELRRATDGLIGSDRTWARVRDGQPDELDLADWLAKYEAAWALLTQRTARADEAEYADLTLTRALGAAVMGVAREQSLARCVIATAPSGMGKSTAAKLVAERLGSRAITVVADPSWAKPSAMLDGLARAIGQRPTPTGVHGGETGAFRTVVELLRGERRMVFLDEAHHLSAKTVNYLIALINQTPGEFVLISIPSLWRKLETAAWEECRQLTRNRLYERIVLNGLPLADVVAVAQRRVPGLGSQTEAASKVFLGLDKGRTEGTEERNFALLVATCREAGRLLEGEAKPTLTHWTQALHHAMARRVHSSLPPGDPTA